MSALRLPAHPIWGVLRTFCFPDGEWVVFGSVPMWVHGLLPGVHDVDVIARDSAWDQATALGTAKQARWGDYCVTVTTDSLTVDIFDGWMGDEVVGIIGRADVVEGIPLASLTDVAAFKRMLNRPKDREHLKLLEGR